VWFDIGFPFAVRDAANCSYITSQCSTICPFLSGRCGDHRLWTPPRVAALHHYQVAVRHSHAWFILEIGGEARNHRRDRPGAIGNGWIMPDVTRHEVAGDDGRIAVDESSPRTFSAIGLLSSIATQLPTSPLGRQSRRLTRAAGRGQEIRSARS
jgi:hypothetical protein